ncbi:MAG: glycosyltransferase family 39 protein [Chloroflexi bacterium]|nr:glycosyltransferase family 39 protein [Chloroflexota bacterium]
MSRRHQSETGWPGQGATLLAFGLLALFLLAFAYRSWAVIRFPYTIEYGEGPVLDWARQFARGGWPYKPIEGFPYTFSVYTPLYLWLSAQFLRLGGPALWGGRLISAGSILLSAWVIYALARREKTAQRWAMMAALLFLASPFAYRWATFFRPDALALAFSLAGMYLAYPVGEKTFAPRRIFFASLLFLLAFYTKQSFVAAPLAYGLVLLSQDRRRGLLWALGMVTAGGLAFAGLNLATGGTFFTDVVIGNANPYNLAAFLRFTGGFLALVALIAISAGGELLMEWRERHLSLAGVYFLCAALVTLSAGKAGAWENYYLETLAVMCLLAAMAWQRLGDRRNGGWATLLVALLVIAQLGLFLPGFERLGPVAEAAWLQHTAQIDEQLSARLAGVPDPILAEDMGILAVNDRPVAIHSFVYTQLAAQGAWDPAPFLQDLAAHRFPLLVLRRGAHADREGFHRFSREMLSAMEMYYACTGRVDGYELCRPARPFRAYDGDLAQTIRLLGYDVSSPGRAREGSGGVIRPGQPLTVTLLWQAEAVPAADYTVFVHLVDAQGKRWAQHDGPPREGTFRTRQWRAGDVIRDVHRLVVPGDAPPGPYQLLVGMYRPETGERLPVASGRAQDNALIIPWHE